MCMASPTTWRAGTPPGKNASRSCMAMTCQRPSACSLRLGTRTASRRKPGCSLSRWLHNTSLLDKLLDQSPDKTAQVIDEFKALIGDVSPPFMALQDTIDRPS